MGRFLITIAALTLFSFAKASDINGTVISGNQPVEFANIGIRGTSTGTSSNAAGHFVFSNLEAGQYSLIVSCIGFINDTIEVTLKSGEVRNVRSELKRSEINMDEVVITGTMKESYLSESPVAIEIVTPKLFQKNPTANIFESLNMVNGVRPQMQCNVCNTGDIHVNGMEGPYTMVLIDGMPVVSALGSVYGLMGIPNSIIQRVEVQKGPASTLYGSEAVGGLINIITKVPQTAPKYSFDIFGTTYNDFTGDFGLRYGCGKKFTGLFSSSAHYYNQRWDINGDNFTDVPLQQRYAVFNKFSYAHSSGELSQVAMRYYYENRWGGQLNWSEEFRGSDSVYGESIYTNRFELIGVSPIRVFNSRFRIQYSFNKHMQNSAYGNTPFLADQAIGFVQLLHNRVIGKHDLLLGVSTRYTWYDDNTVITQSQEVVGIRNIPIETYLPGVFLQDEWDVNSTNTILLGLRYDYNSNHGNIISPRVNWKYLINGFNTLRFGIGNGYRVVNLFSEDHAAFNGARDVVITENLRPEQSWNGTLNYSLLHGFDHGFFSLDASAFYTYFSNKIVADYFTDHTKVIFENLHGYGINRGVGVQAHFSFTFPLKVLVAATYTDIFLKEKNSDGQSVISRQVQTPALTGNFVVSYTIEKLNLSADLTGNVYSPMLLPVLPNDYRPDHSPWFCLMNLQLTKNIGEKWQVYGGVKNLLNFVPDSDPIMRPFDPFDQNVNDPINNPNGYTFDPGYNYAPYEKIRAFIGVRMKIM